VWKQPYELDDHEQNPNSFTFYLIYRNLLDHDLDMLSYQEHHLAHIFLFSIIVPPERFLLNVLHGFHSFYCVWFCVELAIVFCVSHTLCVILTITSPSLINRPLPHPLPLNVDPTIASILTKFIFKHLPQNLPWLLVTTLIPSLGSNVLLGVFIVLLCFLSFFLRFFSRWYSIWYIKMLEMNLRLSIPYLEYVAYSGYHQIQHLNALTEDLSTCGWISHAHP
jgi:hypothetical protein